METPVRRTVKVAPLPSESDGIWAVLQKYGNAAATVLLLAAVVYFIVRWRMNSADAGRAATAGELATARGYVLQLRSPQMEQQSPQSLASFRDRAAGAATDAITNVLNTSTDPAQRAGALIARGDLNWQLANLPALTGAATQPALRPPEEPAIMLGKAESAYQQVLGDASLADQTDAVASAHLGLAAIAENRGDWTKATAQLQAVIDQSGDSAAAAVARAQLTALPGLSQVIPVVALPATQPSKPVVLGPSFGPVTRPAR